jgi:hypothetical protein
MRTRNTFKNLPMSGFVAQPVSFAFGIERRHTKDVK